MTRVQRKPRRTVHESLEQGSLAVSPGLPVQVPEMPPDRLAADSELISDVIQVASRSECHCNARLSLGELTKSANKLLPRFQLHLWIGDENRGHVEG